jgi:hypothetical protein
VGLALTLALRGSGADARRAGSGGRAAAAFASRRQLGPGPRFRPALRAAAVAAARPVLGMRCGAPGDAVGVHLELFADDHVVLVPAGIGLAPPLARRGAYVSGARCEYPLRTMEPTGLILVAPEPRRTVADLFALWGQPLGPGRLAGFRGAVRAYVDGRRWSGPVADVPLDRHAAIALEVGPLVPPHPRYLFPPGL